MKKIFVFLLAFMLLVPTVQAATTEDGIAFSASDDYRTENIMTENPVTIEAEFMIPEGQTERAGVIVGNYLKEGQAGLTIEMTSNGVPRVYYLDNNGTLRSYLFSDVSVPTGKWVHMTFVLDASVYEVHCYIDGVLAKTRAGSRYSRELLNFRDGMVVGNDNRGQSEDNIFDGRIRKLLIYNDIRTAAEIASDAEATTIDTNGLIAGYSLKENANGTNPERITDVSGNGYDLVSSASWAKNPVTINSYAYSMAVVGDTQMLINDAPSAYADMIDWIEDGADTKNTKHVFTLGNYDAAYSYAIADAKLFNLGVTVPYSVVRGHDDTTDNYNLSFTAKRHGSGISDSFDDTMLNTCTKFEAGNVKYMTINLDFEASEDVLNWASALCAANPDRNVIITTYENVLSAAAANGQNFRDMLINKHSNISLVISRDYLSKKVQLTTLAGTGGNTVTYLAMPRLSHSNYALDGLVGMMYFSEDGKNVQFRYYSTAEDKYFMDENQFEFTLDTVALSADNLKDFTLTAPASTERKVTINTDENATITLTDAVVEVGESTTFTVTPKSGYYIKSITVGGAAIDVVDAYNGGTYNTGAINNDTKIVVTIAEIPTVDYVYDGGLDSYPAGYSIAGKTAPSNNPTILSGGNAQTVTIVSENGNNVASVSGSTNNTIIFPNVTVTVGETYDFSADVYVNGTDGEESGYIQLQMDYLTGGSVGDSNISNVTYVTEYGEEIASATSTDATLHMQYLPYNTWIHVEGKVAPTYDGKTTVDSSVNFKFMNATGKVDNVSLTQKKDAWNINLTEANDFGTAYVQPTIAKTATTKLIVTPNAGYGIHSVTLDGTPIVLRRVAKDTRSAEENTWYYTINGANLTADANIVVTYAQYTGNLIDMLNGFGDAEDDMAANTNIKAYNKSVTLTKDSTCKNGGEYSFKADGSANSANPRINVGYVTLPVGEYIFNFDVYSPSAVSGVRINSTGSGSSRFALVDNWYIGNIDLPTAGTWKSYSLKLDVFSETSSSISLYFVNADYVMYYDNVQILKKELAAPAPATANVTISGENAITSVAASTVNVGETTTFTVAPKFGYYIQSITIGGTPFSGFDAYKGGTYGTGEITADTEIVVTVAELSANTEEGVSTAVATLPAVFAEAGEAPVTFGKV
ncbi:MAG: hypothetical protein IKB89_05680, partial [Clostridia bacterium]|nr:hypothetical protein [Clostridia bacterium]